MELRADDADADAKSPTRYEGNERHGAGHEIDPSGHPGDGQGRGQRADQAEGYRPPDRRANVHVHTWLIGCPGHLLNRGECFCSI